MSTLVAQYEQPEPDALGNYHGFTVHGDPSEGYYTMIMRTRKYDGVRVTSSHNSDELRLNSMTKGAAVYEAKQHLNAYVAALGVQ